MKNRTTLFLMMLLLAALWIFPEPAFAAESNAVNPPGWLGGFLAILALALAIGAGIWLRNKQL